MAIGAINALFAEQPEHLTGQRIACRITGLSNENVKAFSVMYDLTFVKERGGAGISAVLSTPPAIELSSFQRMDRNCFSKKQPKFSTRFEDSE